MSNYYEVAVILPVYNGSRYLQESIRSILEQSFSNLKLFICDDGSTDNSYEIIMSFSDIRITVLRNNRNLGLFPTLNRLVVASQAPLVKLWAQDDIMKKECLQQMVMLHKRYPYLAMSYCAYDVIDETGRLVYPASHDTTPEHISPSLASKIMFYYGSITGNISNVMLNRYVLDEVGYFNEALEVSGDYDMWVRICNTHSIGRVKEPLILLRSHNKQFSRIQSSAAKFARENEEIRKALLERLSEDDKNYAREYEKRKYYVYLFHVILHAILRLDFKTAFSIFHIVRLRNSVLEIAFWWLISLNGRFFTIQAKID